MISVQSKLAALVVFFVLGLSSSSKATLRAKDNIKRDESKADEPMEIVTMEDIDAMMEFEEFEREVAGAGLRKLKDDTCWHGGQPNQNLYWLGRYWGNCQSMHNCVCGLQPRRMAYWCPELCRPSCGGKCATSGMCPNGCAVDGNGNAVPTSGTPDMYSYPTFWPGNWGQACTWVGTTRAPAPAPKNTAPSPTGNSQGSSGGGGGGSCHRLNHVCNAGPCCSGLACSPMMSDNNRYCMPS